MTLLPVVLPDDLISEVLSFLDVKFLVRLRCVSKSWKTLISNPTFVKLHLKRSASRNLLFTLITHHITEIPGESPFGTDDEWDVDYCIVPCPIHRLIENPSFSLSVDDYYHLNDQGYSRIVGSCNGLICLVGDSFTSGFQEYWLRLWNPATRATSQKFGYFRNFGNSRLSFMFGCDNTTDTYKVVVSRYIRDQSTIEVKVLSFGDNVWRNIESFPIIPLHLDYRGLGHSWYDGVCFGGTLNWLAIHNNTRYSGSDAKDFTVEQFVIVSLDLGTETYNHYRLPHGFDEVPPVEPNVGVLGDCLCFSYSYKVTNFVIWLMKKFGVEESWTQFLKISYQNLQLDHDFSWNTVKYHLRLIPLFLSEDGDTLILHSNQEREAILYNWKDNRVVRTGVTVHKTIIDNRTNNYLCWHLAKGHVESLVSIC